MNLENAFIFDKVIAISCWSTFLGTQCGYDLALLSGREANIIRSVCYTSPSLWNWLPNSFFNSLLYGLLVTRLILHLSFHYSNPHHFHHQSLLHSLLDLFQESVLLWRRRLVPTGLPLRLSNLFHISCTHWFLQRTVTLSAVLGTAFLSVHLSVLLSHRRYCVKTYEHRMITVRQPIDSSFGNIRFINLFTRDHP